MLLLAALFFFIAANLTLLTASSREIVPGTAFERISIKLIAPFQLIFSRTLGFAENMWTTYFASVTAARDNQRLRKELARAAEAQNRCVELELENQRLRKFIDFQKPDREDLIAAKVIGRDPSPWFRSIMIDKGQAHGLTKGMPVMVYEGIVGQVVNVSERFAKVLLITDRNSSVDALVQDSRARGIVKGNNTDECLFEYALRKDQILIGQVIVSSGLDRVFPKGLRLGEVVAVEKENSKLFQTIVIRPYVDFDKLEEVLVDRVRLQQG